MTHDPYAQTNTTIRIDLKKCLFELLDTPLFNELNTYLKNYPVLMRFAQDGVLTQEEITKLAVHLELHLSDEIISQDLHDVIKGVLMQHV